MGDFWGIEVKPDKPYLHSLPGKLHLTQATLGTGPSKERTLLLCSYKGTNPVFLCSLLPEHTETCHLNLTFHDSAEFSVLGSHSIHLAGHFVAEDARLLVEKTKESEALLPELIEQILPRLPVRSLLRFKCVCKSWRTLITDHRFPKSQFDTTAPAHSHHRLLLNCHNDTQIESLSLESPFQTPAAIINLPTTFHPHPFDFYGSCRGLMLVACWDGDSGFDGDGLVWNPSTGFEQIIPDLDFHAVGVVGASIGFGYNQSEDEFYLVLLRLRNLGRAENEITRISLRNYVWEHLSLGDTEYICYVNSFDYIGQVIGEEFFWLVTKIATNDPVVIHFNWEVRTLSEIAISPDLAALGRLCLRVLGGKLCSCYIGYEGHCAEIWVMTEDLGGRHSWSRSFVLSVDDIPSRCFIPIHFIGEWEFVGPDDVNPVAVGEFIGSDGGGTLLKFNEQKVLVEQRTYELEFENFEKYFLMYAESLHSVPPPPPEDVEE